MEHGYTLACDRCREDCEIPAIEAAGMAAWICPPCRTDDEEARAAEFRLLRAEFEIRRLNALGQGRQPDGRPGRKLAHFHADVRRCSQRLAELLEQ